MNAPAVLAMQRAVGNRAVSRMIDTEMTDAEQPRIPVADAISSPGVPLDPRIRSAAEQAYPMDFGHVRVHDDARAQRSAIEFGARAYTIGPDIVLGPQRPDDVTLFHELDHVYQQSQGPVAGTDDGTGTKVSHPDDPFELQSVENGWRMAHGLAPGLELPPA